VRGAGGEDCEQIATRGAAMSDKPSQAEGEDPDAETQHEPLETDDHPSKAEG
jgi:hypothetical protein